MVAEAIARRVVGFAELTTGNGGSTLSMAQSIMQQQYDADLPTVSRLHRVADRSWNVGGPRVDWRMKRVVKAGDPAGKIVPLFHEFVAENYGLYQHYYTDGSRVPNGGVGVGVFGPGNSEARKLNDACSSFSAEVAALCVAASDIDTEDHRNAVIFSDSASALLALERGRSRHPWIQALDMFPNLTFCWIPGHCGIRGNDNADRLANAGRNGPRLTSFVPGPDLKNWIRDTITEGWKRKWYQERNLFTRKVKDDTDQWSDRSSRKEQQILSRIRIGHTRITHSHFCQGGDRPICIPCNTPLTIEHILVDCLAYEDLRRKHQLTDSIRTILQNNPAREEVLLNFLKDADLYDKI